MSDKIKKQKFKRKFISLEEKIRILDRIKNGEKLSSMAKSLNLNEATIRTIQKNEIKIRKNVAAGCWQGAKRVARKRDINIVKMENVLITWIEDCFNKKIPLNTNIIKQKALRIYGDLKKNKLSSEKHPNLSFLASKGWFENFKKRYSLRNIKFQGEQAATGVEANYADDSKNIYNIVPVAYLTLIDLEKGIALAKKLENFFLEKDPSVIRSEKFKKELRSTLAPYREILQEKKDENRQETMLDNFSNDGEIISEEKFKPTLRTKNILTVISDNCDDEN